MKAIELNKEIRRQIAKNKLRHYEIANHIGVSQFTFAHWLQSEMPKERKEMILQAIKEIAYHENK